MPTGNIISICGLKCPTEKCQIWLTRIQDFFRLWQVFTPWQWISQLVTSTFACFTYFLFCIFHFAHLAASYLFLLLPCNRFTLLLLACIFVYIPISIIFHIHIRARKKTIKTDNMALSVHIFVNLFLTYSVKVQFQASAIPCQQQNIKLT